MDFKDTIKQKTTEELLEIHRSYYNYQREFIEQVEKELKARGAFFIPIDYGEFEKQKAIYQKQKQKERKEDARKNIGKGVLWLIAGIIVSVLSYSLASSSGGGSYVIAIGAIGYGLYRFIDCLFNLF